MGQSNYKIVVEKLKTKGPRRRSQTNHRKGVDPMKKKNVTCQVPVFKIVPSHQVPSFESFKKICITHT